MEPPVSLTKMNFAIKAVTIVNEEHCPPRASLRITRYPHSYGVDLYQGLTKKYP